MAKAKLIKSTGAAPNEPQGKWSNLVDNIKPFIQGIEAGELDINQVSSTLISGIPTPWARAKIFWFAMDYLQAPDPNITQSGLIDFYKTLINEWKGIMALIALYQDRVSFSEPIYMNPEEDNLFELSGAFGRMLLEDVDFWTDQKRKESNLDEKPFLQLLRYQGQLIGATSPFSIIFPASDYGKLEHINEIGWYRNGKFEDPMRYLSNDQLQKLYLYIKNINKNFEGYENAINKGRQTLLNGLKFFLRQWQNDPQFKRLQENGTVAKYSTLVEPFKSLLDSQQKVYQLVEGGFTFDPKGRTVKAELSDLQNILKEDKKIVGWYESSDKKNPLSKAAVYYLKVNDVRDTECPVKYFALPLTMEGIQMFTQQLKTLVSHNDPNFDITGKINEQGNLIVDLTVSIDNQPYKLNSKEYEIEWMSPLGKKVIMWPNFVSDEWDAYYLYSEYPLNIQGIKFVPFFKRGREQKIITIERLYGDKTVKSVIYSNSPDEDLQEGNLKITNLITYPAGQVSPDKHKYEVLKSTRPIAGLEIRIDNAGSPEIAGYLIVKDPDDTTMGNIMIKDYTNQQLPQDAIVGIDFGSNNSCIHYTLTSTSNSEIEPIKFTNRRLALVGIDSDSGATAERDELLFLSNKSTSNGQIKSWLHEHDPLYIGAHRDKEIAGGVSVNEKNIFVNEMDKYKITTQAGILHYNMKWLSDEDGIYKKTAYLKALWLSICADLYAQQYRPAELRWSYPGSMTAADMGAYYDIYNIHLPAITPILSGNNRIRIDSVREQTESESVCKFALSQNFGLTSSNMFLGIDVGGSTSDILLLARDINQNNIPRLYKQSSVRLAAGVFFDAVIKSEQFRKAIYDYHAGQTKIKVENIKDILTERGKAPFYLNNVFDQLSGDDFRDFYSKIKISAPFVYAIPAYVTGLLVYYAGKLCAKTIKENNLTISEVQLLPFGKGGRLFHWIETIPNYRDYYKICFSKGYGQDAEKINLRYRDDIKEDNKSEVAKGLAVKVDIAEFDKSLRETSDIFAEKGILYLQNGQFVNFAEDEEVKSEYFENIGQFEFPAKFENFDEFLRIFIDFVGYNAGLVRNISAIESRSKELRDFLTNYIPNDSEYTKAMNAKQKTNRFEYRFPILIAAGLCYLEKILIPEIFKS
jgi:hypothetical protein